MMSKQRRTSALLVMFLVSALTQTNVRAALLFESRVTATTTIQTTRPIAGRLITRGKLPVLVNGNEAASGMTILPGATIEIPKGTVASVNFESLGHIFLAPETKAILNFDSSNIDVRLIQGCTRVSTSKGVTGVISTDQGRAGATEPEQDSALDVCFPPGAKVPIVDQGMALEAVTNAWSRGERCEECSGVFNLCWNTLAPIIGGGGAAIITTLLIINRGNNPSPMSPLG